MVLLVLLWCSGCERITGQQSGKGTDTPNPADTVVFEGTLEKLGPDPGFVNGILAAYRLAKYRVQRVCKGDYDQSEIVVDHSIFTGKEFDGVNVNDRVCVTVRKSNKIHARNNVEGIRSPEDVVTTFFISEQEVTPPDKGPCGDQ